MRTGLILEYVRSISAAVGGIKPPVPTEPLHALYGRRDFVGMIHHVQQSFRLLLKLKVGFVKSGGPAGCPAWIDLPILMPFFGTREFNDLRLTMHVRKKFLGESPFETVVTIIAHELSHVILSGIHHQLCGEEEAVDLTAMIMGYREFYRKGCEHSTVSEHPFSSAEKTVITSTVGYLTRQEVVFAADYMEFKD